MIMDWDRCASCGHWTQKGLDKLHENSKLHPIFNTDFSKPLSQIIEETRSRIVNVRGTLQDIEAACPGWKERVEIVSGLLSCGLVALHYVKEEMVKFEQQQKDRTG
jgi:hypothetical protein